MSTSSPRKLRSGKCLISTSSNTEISASSSETNIYMENNVNLTNEQTQPGSHSPIIGFASQQANEERFNHLQTEMSALKAMMEKLIQQNQEKERQTDASASTSSFAVRASNTDVVSHRGDKNSGLSERDFEQIASKIWNRASN